MKVEEWLEAKPLGTWSLAGGQLKTVAQFKARLSCRCGWAILGVLDGDSFLGESSTQMWPPAASNE
jgi:hypothetical protein